MEVEIPRREQYTLKTPSFKLPDKNYHHHQQQQQQGFELKVIYLRTIINSSNYNMKSCINLLFPPRGAQTCLEINGLKINPSKKATRALNMHREDAFMSESIYINTDTIRFKGFCLPFQVQIQGSASSSPLVLVSGSLRLKDNGLISGSTFYNYMEDLKWVLECKEGGDEENCCDVINGGLVDAYFAGQSSGKPFLLNEFAKLKKTSCRGLDCIDEDDETDGLINSKELGEKPIKKFEQKASDPQDINIDEEEEMFFEEEGQLSWFSAGVRVGIGLAVGLSIGVGAGLGLIKRTFKLSYSVFNRVFYIKK